MTKQQALQEFREFFGVVRGDAPMNRENWNNYTDMLRTDKRITAKQYSTWSNPF